MPLHGGENVWIHLIENHDGIIFSDGQFTSGQKHWSTSVKEWLIACDERQHAPSSTSSTIGLWVKSEPSALKWSDVSLYSNPFDDVAARTAFETGLHGLRLSSTSPEFTSEGSYPKCCRTMPEGIMLYKTGSTGASNTGLEPYSEAMASKIAAGMKGADTVAYGLAKFKDRLCSTCRLFTDESTGFVPAYKVFSDNPPRNIAQALKLCCGLGFEREFRDMIVLDAVTFNQDRHLGNFGFLIDNDTFEIKRFAPLFDFNVSRLCFATDADLETDEAVAGYFRRNDVGHRLGGDFVEVALKFMTPERRDRMPKAVRLPRDLRYSLPDGCMERLDEIFQQNYDCVRNGHGPGFGKLRTTEPVHRFHGTEITGRPVPEPIDDTQFDG